MAKIKYDKWIQEAWEDAKECRCDKCGGDRNQHRICPLCGKPMQYGCHESIKDQQTSKYAWNVDHIIPLSRGGEDKRKNRQAVHIKCNCKKANR